MLPTGCVIWTSSARLCTWFCIWFCVQNKAAQAKAFGDAKNYAVQAVRALPPPPPHLRSSSRVPSVSSAMYTLCSRAERVQFPLAMFALSSLRAVASQFKNYLAPANQPHSARWAA